MKIIANERVIEYFLDGICPSDLFGGTKELHNCEDCQKCLMNNNIFLESNDDKKDVDIILSFEEVCALSVKTVIGYLLAGSVNIRKVNFIREE